MKSIFILFIITIHCLKAQTHPSLALTKKGVAEIRTQLGKVPIFDKTLKEVKTEVDAEIAKGIDVPIPKDMAGGYTHETHKRNALMLQKSGALYQILADDTYAIYVRDMLLEYEKMYKKLPVHPQERSYARGKLFWQCLNDANWLVYASQAYDCIYDFITKKQQKLLNKSLFRAYADFISIENPQFFNRVHNHSTWGNVAVGMIGLVMNDDELIHRALYGLKAGDLDMNEKDNDGAYIRTKGQKFGFLANIDEPFSPDGYYTEGGYYQRYAMYPFLTFAQALENTKPNLKIFEYKEGVLIKSVNTLINLSDANGDFFALNDAQKGMSYYARELVSAVDIAYHYGNQSPELLSIVNKQNKVLLNDAGLAVAMAISKGKAKPFHKKSANYRDGAEGKQGGVAVLRSDPMTLVMKYSAQGLSHGHYDKLSFSLYESGTEILQDYGLARFVNIEQKNGGGYLKENTTWAKQTIAHNTVIQDETSHFGGDYAIGSTHHSDLYFYDDSNPTIQIISAKESNAYTDTKMHRTMAVIKTKDFIKPIVLDIMKVKSNAKHQYDLPFHYLGQLMETNFSYKTFAIQESLGKSSGYQHLWREAEGKPEHTNSKVSFLNDNKFYTLTTLTDTEDNLIFGRLGANDPHFNLRRDSALILRKKNIAEAIFVSTIESHGVYSPVSEFAVNAYSQMKNLSVVYDKAPYTAIEIENVQGIKHLFILNAKTSDTETSELKINNKTYKWKGFYYFK